MGRRWQATYTSRRKRPVVDSTDSHHVSLRLPERTVVQLDELVRHGHFSTRQAAMVGAVERLYADEEIINA